MVSSTRMTKPQMKKGTPPHASMSSAWPSWCHMLQVQVQQVGWEWGWLQSVSPHMRRGLHRGAYCLTCFLCFFCFFLGGWGGGVRLSTAHKHAAQAARRWGMQQEVRHRLRQRACCTTITYALRSGCTLDQYARARYISSVLVARGG